MIYECWPLLLLPEHSTKSKVTKMYQSFNHKLPGQYEHPTYLIYLRKSHISHLTKIERRQEGNCDADHKILASMKNRMRKKGDILKSVPLRTVSKILRMHLTWVRGYSESRRQLVPESDQHFVHCYQQRQTIEIFFSCQLSHCAILLSSCFMNDKDVNFKQKLNFVFQIIIKHIRQNEPLTFAATCKSWTLWWWKQNLWWSQNISISLSIIYFSVDAKIQRDFTFTRRMKKKQSKNSSQNITHTHIYNIHTPKNVITIAQVLCLPSARKTKMYTFNKFCWLFFAEEFVEFVSKLNQPKVFQKWCTFCRLQLSMQLCGFKKWMCDTSRTLWLYSVTLQGCFSYIVNLVC